MSGAPKETKSERLVARLSPDDKALVERAAELEGRSLAAFVVAHLRDHAREVIEKQAAIHLNAEQSRRFTAALQAAPKKPTAAMRRALVAYRDSVIES